MRESATVDLFCGVGGLTHGFVLEGLKVVAGLDFDESCRYAYERNNHVTFLHRDIRKVKGGEISRLYPKGATKILVGCAPCQPFSSYANGNRRQDRWDLLYEFARLIKEVRPDIVSMENVPHLKGYKNQKHSVFADFIRNLEDNRYHVSYRTVYCPEYGIPQTRRRLVLLASKFGRIDIIEKTHTADKYPTVRDAIGGLDKIKDGEVSASDPLHRSRRLTPINKKRVKNTPYGGDWRDWSKELRLRCHKKKSGKSFRRVYGRMVWDEPGPTITTQCIGIGNGRFGHPEQCRAISLREAALLQTFPMRYDFIDPKSKFSGHKIARYIGNAVPVKLGRIIARSIQKHLSDYYGG